MKQLVKWYSIVGCVLSVMMGCSPPNESEVSFRSEPSVIGNSQMEDVACYNGTWTSFGRPVVHLEIPNGNTVNECTGFFVDKRNIITAAHCVSTQAVATNVVVEFDFQHSTCNGSGFLTGGSTVGTTLLTTNSLADVTVLQLDNDYGLTYGVMDMNFSNMTTSQNLAIVHHPDGQYKQVTLSTDTGVCHATTVQGDFNFTHKCDTLPGSSGAPVVLQPNIGVTAPYSVIGMHTQGTGVGHPNDNLGVRSYIFSNVVEPYLSPEDSCAGKCGRQVHNRNGTAGCYCLNIIGAPICPDKVQYCGKN